MSDPMENELRRYLRPVVAPEGLWNRIQEAQRSGARKAAVPVRPLWFLPLCATMLVLMTAGLLWGIRQSRTHVRDLAQVSDTELRVLADISTGDSYSSDDPIRIRDWVKSRSSIDVELPSSRSEAIHLLGAKLVRLRGSLIAAVSYKVGAESATLLIARPGGCCNADAGSPHLFTKTETASGASLTSWNMHEQAYTIAYAGSGEPQGACQLCHAEARVRL